MPWTNRGKYLMSASYLRGDAAPTNFYAALCSVTNPPSATTNTLSQLSEIPAGNGYTSGGLIVNRNGTGFPSILQNDINNEADATLLNLAWTAVAGNLPSSGSARYLVLTDDNVTIANRQVIAYWDLASGQIVSSGYTMTFSGFVLVSKDV